MSSLRYTSDSKQQACQAATRCMNMSRVNGHRVLLSSDHDEILTDVQWQACGWCLLLHNFREVSRACRTEHRQLVGGAGPSIFCARFSQTIHGVRVATSSPLASWCFVTERLQHATPSEPICRAYGNRPESPLWKTRPATFRKRPDGSPTKRAAVAPHIFSHTVPVCPVAPARQSSTGSPCVMGCRSCAVRSHHGTRRGSA